MDDSRSSCGIKLAVVGFIIAFSAMMIFSVSQASASICVLPWCTYYDATPPVNQYQCGSRCAAAAKTKHRMSAAATPSHRMEIMEAINGTIVPGTQVISTGTNAGTVHASMTTNQYCRINKSMKIKCDWK